MCETEHSEDASKNFQDDEPPAKKSSPTIQLDAGFKWNLQALAKAAESVETGGKSPVSALNELGVRVSYSVLRQGGPAHCPSFTVAVTVADMTFEGWGHSKREARASAARTCLSALLARAGRVLPNPGPQPDFTSDEPPKYPVSEFQCIEAKIQPPEVNDKKASPPPGLFGPSVSPVHKSPINTLYENYPGITFICTFGDGSPLDTVQAPVQLSHSMRFKVVCQIKNQTFEGYGSSKKLAKLAAARSALGEMCDRGAAQTRPSASDALPQALADHIAKLVNEKFNDIMKGDLVHSKRKVLAGIVMTIDNKIEGAKVIAVTTGTKCVSGEHMSVRGRAVNDCHAEVAARRCLQRHLYAQLLMYANAADPTVPIPESDIEPFPGGGYQLRPDRQLHLYVSTAPCGDGRIFSPHEHHETEPDRHPNRLARGQLRTKIESGEGTIPVKNCTNILQTWDGVLQGERLLTMSCSDKAARWCVSGLQGALLARLLRPVYLRSLVLGSLLHHHHLHRAICGRIEGYISALPPPYQLTRPLLARAASTEARTPARAPSFSVCWSITSPLPEIINATTGKLENGHPSLLCKQSMFARWQYLVRRLPLLPQDPNGPPLPPLPKNLDYLLYNEAKALCTTYQVAKDTLTAAFERAQLGRWIKKPIEQDQFQCEILGADPTLLFAWAGDAQGSNIVQINAGRSTDTGNTASNLNNADEKTVSKNYDKSVNLDGNSDVKFKTCERDLRNDKVAIRIVDSGIDARFDSQNFDRVRKEVRNVELDKESDRSLLLCDRSANHESRDDFSDSVVKEETSKLQGESACLDRSDLRVRSKKFDTSSNSAQGPVILSNINDKTISKHFNNDTSSNNEKAQLDIDDLNMSRSKLNINPDKENDKLNQNSDNIKNSTSNHFTDNSNNNSNISCDSVKCKNNFCDNLNGTENFSKNKTLQTPKQLAEDAIHNNIENNLNLNNTGNNIDKYDSSVKKVLSKILARKNFNDQYIESNVSNKNKVLNEDKQIPHSVDNTNGIISSRNLDPLDSRNSNVVDKNNDNFNVYDAKSSLLRRKLAIYRGIYSK